jgi:hypothetical protein
MATAEETAVRRTVTEVIKLTILAVLGQLKLLWMIRIRRNTDLGARRELSLLSFFYA